MAERWQAGRRERLRSASAVDDTMRVGVGVSTPRQEPFSVVILIQRRSLLQGILIRSLYLMSTVHYQVLLLTGIIASASHGELPHGD